MNKLDIVSCVTNSKNLNNVSDPFILFDPEIINDKGHSLSVLDVSGIKQLQFGHKIKGNHIELYNLNPTSCSNYCPSTNFLDLQNLSSKNCMRIKSGGYLYHAQVQVLIFLPRTH